jgi:flavodoxin I
MKKIGLFYATKADKTTWVAEKIQKEFGKDRIEVVPIEHGKMILQLTIVL